ncbi:Glutamine-rich protein 2 [Penaeus vannamei]|uniref:Glutamine-rich protein 2 n=1 Tax=Penaeus vannamei TaxID=6689 RepID=A0A3R7N0Z9_PENVA|nr:Glutamine-rich protein 2 [Penaeus vannamei]
MVSRSQHGFLSGIRCPTHGFYRIRLPNTVSIGIRCPTTRLPSVSAPQSASIAIRLPNHGDSYRYPLPNSRFHRDPLPNTFLSTPLSNTFLSVSAAQHLVPSYPLPNMCFYSEYPPTHVLRVSDRPTSFPIRYPLPQPMVSSGYPLPKTGSIGYPAPQHLLSDPLPPTGFYPYPLPKTVHPYSVPTRVSIGYPLPQHGFYRYPSPTRFHRYRSPTRSFYTVSLPNTVFYGYSLAKHGFLSGIRCKHDSSDIRSPNTLIGFAAQHGFSSYPSAQHVPMGSCKHGFSISGTAPTRFLSDPLPNTVSIGIASNNGLYRYLLPNTLSYLLPNTSIGIPLPNTGFYRVSAAKHVFYRIVPNTGFYRVSAAHHWFSSVSACPTRSTRVSPCPNTFYRDLTAQYVSNRVSIPQYGFLSLIRSPTRFYRVIPATRVLLSRIPLPNTVSRFPLAKHGYSIGILRQHGFYGSAPNTGFIGIRCPTGSIGIPCPTRSIGYYCPNTFLWVFYAHIRFLTVSSAPKHGYSYRYRCQNTVLSCFIGYPLPPTRISFGDPLPKRFYRVPLPNTFPSVSAAQHEFYRSAAKHGFLYLVFAAQQRFPSVIYRVSLPNTVPIGYRFPTWFLSGIRCPTRLTSILVSAAQHVTLLLYSGIRFSHKPTIVFIGYPLQHGFYRVIPLTQHGVYRYPLPQHGSIGIAHLNTVLSGIRSPNTFYRDPSPTRFYPVSAAKTRVLYGYSAAKHGSNRYPLHGFPSVSRSPTRVFIGYRAKTRVSSVSRLPHGFPIGIRSPTRVFIRYPLPNTFLSVIRCPWVSIGFHRVFRLPTRFLSRYPLHGSIGIRSQTGFLIRVSRCQTRFSMRYPLAHWVPSGYPLTHTRFLSCIRCPTGFLSVSLPHDFQRYPLPHGFHRVIASPTRFFIGIPLPQHCVSMVSAPQHGFLSLIRFPTWVLAAIPLPKHGFLSGFRCQTRPRFYRYPCPTRSLIGYSLPNTGFLSVSACPTRFHQYLAAQHFLSVSLPNTGFYRYRCPHGVSSGIRFPTRFYRVSAAQHGFLSWYPACPTRFLWVSAAQHGFQSGIRFPTRGYPHPTLLSGIHPHGFLSGIRCPTRFHRIAAQLGFIYPRRFLSVSAAKLGFYFGYPPPNSGFLSVSAAQTRVFYRVSATQHGLSGIRQTRFYGYPLKRFLWVSVPNTVSIGIATNTGFYRVSAAQHGFYGIADHTGFLLVSAAQHGFLLGIRLPNTVSIGYPLPQHGFLSVSLPNTVSIVSAAQHGFYRVSAAQHGFLSVSAAQHGFLSGPRGFIGYPCHIAVPNTGFYRVSAAQHGFLSGIRCPTRVSIGYPLPNTVSIGIRSNTVSIGYPLPNTGFYRGSAPQHGFLSGIRCPTRVSIGLSACQHGFLSVSAANTGFLSVSLPKHGFYRVSAPQHGFVSAALSGIRCPWVSIGYPLPNTGFYRLPTRVSIGYPLPNTGFYRVSAAQHGFLSGIRCPTIDRYPLPNTGFYRVIFYRVSAAQHGFSIGYPLPNTGFYRVSAAQHGFLSAFRCSTWFLSGIRVP